MYAYKSYDSYPVKGANNIGFTPEKFSCKTSIFNEGQSVSRALNKVGGINAVAGLHDIFQLKLPDALRSTLNVPGMPVAAVVTYAALYSQIECPLC